MPFHDSWILARAAPDNPRIPICLYDELHFRTASGLNEVVQLSRNGVGEGFAAAVKQLGTITQTSSFPAGGVNGLQKRFADGFVQQS